MKSDPLADCTICGRPFMRRNSLQSVCGVRCATKVATSAKRERQEADRAQRLAFERRKEAAKTLPRLRKEARDAFHAYIRARDYGKPCICCGKSMPWHESTPGGYIDAGHFMSRGSCPELRWDEINTNAQLKSCNRPNGTTRASFRAGMIERYGLAEVERLEGPNPPRRDRADDLREIRDTYRQKLRDMRK